MRLCMLASLVMLVDDLYAEFMTKASAKGLDDSCVKDIERPPFVTKLPPQLAK